MVLSAGVLGASLANSAFARTVVAWVATPAAAADASSATSRLPLVTALLLWCLVVVVGGILALYAKRSHERHSTLAASHEVARTLAVIHDRAAATPSAE